MSSSVFQTRYLFAPSTPQGQDTHLDLQAQAPRKTYFPHGDWGRHCPKLPQKTYVRPEPISRAPISLADLEWQSDWRPKNAILGFRDPTTSTNSTTQVPGLPPAAQQPRETFPKPKTFTLGTCSPPRRADIHPPATASIGAQVMEAELCDFDSSSNEEDPIPSGTLPPFSALNPDGWDRAAELGRKSPPLEKLCSEMDARLRKLFISPGPPSSVYSQYSPYPPVSPSPRKGGAEDISLGAARPGTVEGMAGHPLANAMTAQGASPTDGLADGEHGGRARRPSLEAYKELVSRWRRYSCPDTPIGTSTPVLLESDLKVRGAWPMPDGALELIGLETVLAEKPELTSSSEAKPSTGGLGADKPFSGTSSSPLAKTELEFEVPTEGAEDLPQEKFPGVCGARKAAFSEGLMSPVEQPIPLKRRKRSNAADSAPYPPVVQELGDSKASQGPGRNNRDMLRKGEGISAFRSGLSGTDKSQSDHGGESPTPESPGDDKARGSLDHAVVEHFGIDIAYEQTTRRGSYKEILTKHSHRTDEQAEKRSAPINDKDTKTGPVFREYGPATLGGGKAILAAKRYRNLKRDDAGNGNKANEGIHANKETKNFPRPLSSHPPVASVESTSESESELQDPRDDVASPSSTTTTCGSNSSTRSRFKVPKAKTWPCNKGQDHVSAEPFAGRPYTLCTIQGTGDSASQAAGGTQEDEGKIEDDEEEKRGRSGKAKPCTSTTTTRGSGSSSSSTPPPTCKAPAVKLSLRGGGSEDPPTLKRNKIRPTRRPGTHPSQHAGASKREEMHEEDLRLSATSGPCPWPSEISTEFSLGDDASFSSRSSSSHTPSTSRSSFSSAARSSIDGTAAAHGTFAPPDTVYPARIPTRTSASDRTAHTGSGSQGGYKKSRFTEAIGDASEASSWSGGSTGRGPSDTGEAAESKSRNWRHQCHEHLEGMIHTSSRKP